MINYAQFTTEQLETMAKHGATPELRDRARAELVIHHQEQAILDLHRQNASMASALKGLLEIAQAAIVNARNRNEYPAIIANLEMKEANARNVLLVANMSAK